MTTPTDDWVEELSESRKDFTLTHTPCGAVLTGGADTPENAQLMIENNKSGHVCSV